MFFLFVHLELTCVLSIHSGSRLCLSLHLGSSLFSDFLLKSRMLCDSDHTKGVTKATQSADATNEVQKAVLRTLRAKGNFEEVLLRAMFYTLQPFGCRKCMAQCTRVSMSAVKRVSQGRFFIPPTAHTAAVWKLGSNLLR